MILGFINNIFFKHASLQRKLFYNTFFFFLLLLPWLRMLYHFLFKFTKTSCTSWKHAPPCCCSPGRSFITSFITYHLWSDSHYLILTAMHCLGLFKSLLWFLILPCHLQLYFIHHNPSVTWQIFFSPYYSFFAAISLSLDWIKAAALNLPLHLWFFFWHVQNIYIPSIFIGHMN